jgi:hypothetical protein
VAFERIRAEFVEMPGMCLTPEQLERLSGVNRGVCKCVLDDLVRAKFLRVSPNGSYRRLSDASMSESKSLTGGTDRQEVPRWQESDSDLAKVSMNLKASR